jgi:hypothetical protein
MGAKRNAHNILVENLKEKTTQKTYEWREIVWEDADCVHLAKDRDQ